MVVRQNNILFIQFFEAILIIALTFLKMLRTYKIILPISVHFFIVWYLSQVQ
jgi:hypothetical protein